MPLTGVSSSQQTSAPTPYVKERDQEAIPQRHTPDTLVGKNVSSSCSFRYCFTRIYDFFCALFRCLFCIKDKPTKPNTDKPTKPNTDQTPSEQARAFYRDHDVSEGALDIASTEAAFMRLPPKVRSCFLDIMRTNPHPSYRQRFSALDQKASALPANTTPDPKVVPPKTEPQAPSTAQVLPNTNTAEPQEAQLQDPDEAANTFLRTNGPGFFSDGRTYQQTAVESLKAAAEDFAKLHPKVQDRVLLKMKSYLLTEFVYDALKVYLSKECLRERYDAFVKLGITVSSDDSYRLSQAFENGFGSTYAPPKEPQKSPDEEATDFFGLFKGDFFRHALRLGTACFKDKSPEVQDVILYRLAVYGYDEVLFAYLTEEGLGAERNQAFLTAYGKKFLQKEAPSNRSKLEKIFQDGFGSTVG